MTPGEDLLSLLRRRISRRGRITFREFMEVALYEPRLGRYSRPDPPMGPAGDYITSPEVDEAFGRLLGRAVAAMHSRLAPAAGGEPFTVIEMGPGRGSLCRDLLRGMAADLPELHRSLRYVLVESSEALRGAQRGLLEGESCCEGRVEWSSWTALAAAPPVTGCILANEFLDALPVHLVEMRGGRIMEVHVTAAPGGGLAEELGEPSESRLESHFRDLGITLGEGQRAEVSFEALRWIGEAASVLGRGFVMIVDYGHEAAELYSDRHYAGTLLGYRRHQVVSDPLASPGEQDLTSHVDFTSLARRAREAGFEGSALTTQRNLLVCLGLPEMIAELALPGGSLSEGEKVRKRFALHSLMSPAGMGSTFKVQLIGKGAAVEGLPFMRDPFREPVERAGPGV